MPKGVHRPGCWVTRVVLLMARMARQHASSAPERSGIIASGSLPIPPKAGWSGMIVSEYRLEETWECYSINSDYELVKDGYEVNAWFRHDWIPLSAEDVQQGLLLLSWGREELLKIVSNLGAEILERTYPGERWSIAGILKHIGGAEWWYQDRLGLAFPRQDVPDDPFQRLEKVRSNLVEILPGLAGSKQVIGVSGEFWSPRKLLRRAVWHEYDHIAHIRKLL